MIFPMTYAPIKFINESIEACYHTRPTLEKKSGCPDWFVWRNEEYMVIELISEWHDYQRKGRMARNMKETHTAAAARRGSWGVGQDYYRIKTKGDQIFDIYYDRSPKGSDNRKGEWFVYRELRFS
jgi:hypothetical protein